jgi:hypothetical protein
MTATNFQDLGLILFSALALYLASRGLRYAALAALLAALLCKEMAVVTAAVLPLVMPSSPGGSRTRWRWAAASAAVVIVWGAVYWQVMNHAHLLLARDAGPGPETPAMPWLARFVWACGRSLLDASGLAVLTAPMQRGMKTAWAALAVLALAVVLRDGAARGRLRVQAAWGWGGLIGFALATATLADGFPTAPARSTLGTVSALPGCPPGAAAELAARRLAVLHVAVRPCPPLPVVIAPDFGGAFLGFARLAAQRPRRRATSLAAVPRTRHRRAVAPALLSAGTLHAFAGDRSIQTRYRDTTLGSWAEAAVEGEHRDASSAPVPAHAAAPGGAHPSAGPISRWVRGTRNQSDWAGALPELARADSRRRTRTPGCSPACRRQRALALVEIQRYGARTARWRSLTLWAARRRAWRWELCAQSGGFPLRRGEPRAHGAARPRDAKLASCSRTIGEPASQGPR